MCIRPSGWIQPTETFLSWKPRATHIRQVFIETCAVACGSPTALSGGDGNCIMNGDSPFRWMARLLTQQCRKPRSDEQANRFSSCKACLSKLCAGSAGCGCTGMRICGVLTMTLGSVAGRSVARNLCWGRFAGRVTFLHLRIQALTTGCTWHRWSAIMFGRQCARELGKHSSDMCRAGRYGLR